MNFEISSATLLSVAVGAIACLLGLRALGWLITLLPMSRARRRQLRRTLPVIEVGVVVAFLLLVVPALVGGDPKLSPLALVAVLAAVAGVSWAALRDFASGVVFRTTGSVEVGDLVEVGSVAGRVARIGYRTLELETEDGAHAYLPMSQVTGKSIQLRRRTDRVMHRFTVRIPDKMDAADARERARLAALLSHWSSIAREPEVREISLTELEVKVYALAEARTGEIEAQVRRALNAAR